MRLLQQHRVGTAGQRGHQVATQHRHLVAQSRVGDVGQGADGHALGSQGQRSQAAHLHPHGVAATRQPGGGQVPQSVGDAVEPPLELVEIGGCGRHTGTLAVVPNRRGVPHDSEAQQTRLIPRVPPATQQTRVLPGSTPPAPAAPPPRRRRRRWPWVLLVLVVGYPLLLAGLVLVGLDRVVALPTGDRPADTPGRTWLVVGSDSREGLSDEEREELSTGGGTSRLTDTILLVTTAPDGRATLISIPRDSYVDIPGYGFNKINAAYAFGGPRLLSRTVEQATGVRLDGYVEVGFDGFYRVVQAVGGVRVCPPDPISDERAGIDLPAGCQVLGGADALGYVRARYSDPRGDLGRVERQREFVAALADQATSPAVLLNPFRSVPLALAVGEALTVNRTMGPFDLAAFSLATLRATGSGGQMLTVPVGGDATTDVGSVVLWDEQQAAALWQALQDGTPIPRRLLN